MFADNEETQDTKIGTKVVHATA